jgi:ketosteroid isomerase-like protein
MNMSSSPRSVVVVAMVLVGFAAPIVAQERVPTSRPGVTAETVFDPSPNDSRIVAVLDALQKRSEAMRTGDLAAVRKYMPREMVVNAPINRVVDGKNVLDRLARGEIAYEEGGQSVIEFAGVRGDLVVLMGRQELKPVGNAPNAGKTIRRRWTDIWRQNSAGEWQNIIRHATIYSIE